MPKNILVKMKKKCWCPFCLVFKQKNYWFRKLFYIMIWFYLVWNWWMLVTLKKHFGYGEFRPLQEKIIRSVMEKRDTFVVMPTGGGKSLCYQLPALLLDGVTIVVSPLIALMKDQVDGLKANGIAAAFINSSLTENERQSVKLWLKKWEIKILYIAPERLNVDGFKDFIKQINVSLIAIDEAHCISEWGHDFRPSYSKLQVLKSICPEIPIIALTATATPKVQKDIIQKLDLINSNNFLGSFDRPNLSLRVVRKRNTFDKLLNLLEKKKWESVIIYCYSRKETEKIADKLRLAGHNALPYHAWLKNEIRKRHQEMFIKDDVDIIVATIAFGMGIDKPDVRLVVHYVFPKTLEWYYQEIGRAGRDGLASDCVLFYSYGDKRKHDFFIDQMDDVEEQSRVRKKLREMIDYCELTSCRRKYLLRYFWEKWKNLELSNSCRNCDVCLPSDVELEVLDSSRPKRIGAGSGLNYNRVLFDKLRVLRKSLSSKYGIAPFMVFSDLSLQEMAYYFPVDLETFGQITWVGKQKLESFGLVFLSEIKIFLNENIDIVPKNKIKSLSKTKSRKKKNKVPNHIMTAELIGQKFSLEEIVKKQWFRASTIIKHIERLSLEWISCDVEYLRPEEKMLTEIKSAFVILWDGELKPVFDYLNAKYSYEDIALVKLFL